MAKNQSMTVQIGGRKLKSKKRKSKKRKIRLNSQGFKVAKGTVVYVGSATLTKPAPRTELVDMVKEMLRNYKDLKPMRKHISAITITFQRTNHFAGFWQPIKQKLEIIDNGSQTVKEFTSTLIHEIIGHTFYWFAMKWRRLELIDFNKIANELPPITTYVKENEKKWKDQFDDNELQLAFEKKYNESIDESYIDNEQYNKDYEELKQKQETNGHKGMTRYANEQHSAIAEKIHGFGGHKVLLDDKTLEPIIDAYRRLHY